MSGPVRKVVFQIQSQYECGMWRGVLIKDTPDTALLAVKALRAEMRGSKFRVVKIVTTTTEEVTKL